MNLTPSVPEPPGQPQADGFHTTRWSLIAQAGSSTNIGAMESLCRAYWKPVYYFVRRRGHGHEDARDLTQEFFARLLEKNWLGDADRGRGRFRSFLLGAVNHFLNNEWNRTRAVKRGGGFSFVSFDVVPDHEFPGAFAGDTESPERQFDRKWLNTILATVVGRLRAEFAASGKDGHFEVLKVFLTENRGSHPYAEAAANLGMSESGVKAAIWRLRQRYGELFRAEVAQTVQDPSEVEDEIRYLLGLMK